MAHTLTTCTFCGAGCGVYLETAGGEIVGAYPSMSHPTNEGRICVRGWHLHEIASAQDRLKTPLIKRDGRYEEATWAEAFSLIASRTREIRAASGPDAFAFLISPRCSNEEAYLLQKLARTVIGTNNVDHGAGVYSNNSINVLLDMIGAPATTNSLGDLPCSDVIVVDGVDLARQLPTVGGRVIRARLNGAKLIVIDTRRHCLAENADCFLQLRPGTEALLYGAIAKVIVDRGLMNLPFIRAHCRDYEAFLAGVADYDLLEAAEVCGLPAELIESAALFYARAGDAAILYSTGVEARSTEAVQAIVNLVLLTGHIGRPGSGLFALTEQNNLQGVCDVGMLPDRLPGYRPVNNPAARAELETLWNGELPAEPGLSARTILDEAGKTPVKALWLCRYDPITTAFCGNVVDALKQCEFVVAQHLFMTNTAQYADVVLPAAAYGEERVSFTSTDRRIQIAEKVIEPQSSAMPAWQQIVRFAQAMGQDWDYPTSADVMDEIGRVVPFYSGASYDNLAREYGRQWPCTTDRPLGTPVLFADEPGDWRFRFAAVPKPAPPPVTEERPFVLVFGHSLYYWHQNVVIKHSETLKREYRTLLLDYPEGFVDINSEDAKRLGIRNGEVVRLCAESGAATAAARVTSEVRSGAVYVPYFVRQVHQQIRGSGENGLQFIPVRVERQAR